ncbi:hypothetical protein U9M48_007662 [Paspalum notatum var. saurae]|uniref:Protein EARLY FLOWERING 4 domain-containing protein n=1 Tax=Paspalum notatum var. saurae TaxID=547442 RepID=A0AAQ3SMT4_PASNO
MLRTTATTTKRSHTQRAKKTTSEQEARGSTRDRGMEGGETALLGGGGGVDTKVLHSFQTSFVQVQSLLDQNRVLINEINQNHESKVPGDLSRNVGLIRELNNNIRRVVDLYADLSSLFAAPDEAAAAAASEGGSVGTARPPAAAAGHKRIRLARLNNLKEELSACHHCFFPAAGSITFCYRWASDHDCIALQQLFGIWICPEKIDLAASVEKDGQKINK